MCLIGLPWKYDLVRRYATARRRIERRSSLLRMFCSNGRREARWSSSALRRSLWRFDGLDFWTPSFGGGLMLKLVSFDI